MSYLIDAVDVGATPLSEPATVFIAPEDILARWSSHSATPRDLLAFADADAQHALDVIERRRPGVVVLEQMFAHTTRGEALVQRMRANPDLAQVEIRVLPADRSRTFGQSGPASGTSLATLAAPLLAPGPIRRARRVRMPNGAELLVDGAPAALIDLSSMGAQVVSTTILRPSQNVRVVLTDDGATVRAVASIAWSALELSRDASTYRAGVEFEDPHPEFLDLTEPPRGM